MSLYRIPLILLLCIACLNSSFAQEKDLGKIADSISAEGNRLFRSEWASWYGSDIFSLKCKSRRAIAGGYISYDNGNGLTNIFFTKGDEPKTLSTITFGYDFNFNNYKIDTADRAFTALESDLYAIRKNAIAEIYKDTIFKTYKNTSLNFVPLIQAGIKKVYILTGPNKNGVVVFGNDYLIGFDKDNQVVSKKKLHKGIIAITTSRDTSDSKINIASMHSHLPEYSEFITATDICTLMLYEQFTTWNQHVVISKKYASVWDCKRNKLAIMTMEAWEKMNPLRSALENNSH